jgi:2-polyprenyl-3-methyl-5-hydroxy-6-metoxy-1,4-benzoquinol methylase
MSQKCPNCGTSEILMAIQKIDWDITKPFFNADFFLYECAGCGLFYAHPISQEKERQIQKFYSESYNISRSDDDWKKSMRQIHCPSSKKFIKTALMNPIKVFAKLGICRSIIFKASKEMQVLYYVLSRGFKTLLDIGCGYGYFLSLARTSGLEAYGLEPTIQVTEYAKSIGVGWIEHGVCSGSEYSIGPLDSYDVIVMIQTLTNIKITTNLFKLIKKHINRNGAFIVVSVDPDKIPNKITNPSFISPLTLNMTGKKFMEGICRKYLFKSYEYQDCIADTNLCLHILQS